MTNIGGTQNVMERKPARNFIKENIHSIRQLQGIMKVQGESMSRRDKFRNAPLWVPRREAAKKMATQNEEVVKSNEVSKSKQKLEYSLKAKSDIKRCEKKRDVPPESLFKFSHRSVQTENTDDPSVLYETGVIRYSSLKPSNSKVDKSLAEGDFRDTEDSKGRDYIKENILNLKPKPTRQVSQKVPADVPPTYQQGQLPKYLQVKKEKEKEEDDTCPTGHVLLPDSERKETLKVLRESYADRVQELNSLPVRSDTLRVKKRKQQIEEELRKLDSGIKVFQRPKVYVKINM
ncbi:uncharacterized protein LOC114330301 [Diabrotica virgifera virgifera]|uniref:Uncharacterized protein LOC114330301 n=1 Tax=Diabrotica virgifera virgifera TaxID=50390 RepID=A0A6P7FH86_DIAVI|nr:uncharacterized protein LOC114330301 [Diabrotica virgifera virgifera]